MKTSEKIEALSAAFSNAQAKLKFVGFDKDNPHYRSKFASLKAIVEMLRGPMLEQGLSFSQGIMPMGEGFMLVTRIIHSSGQWMETETPLLFDRAKGMQGLGAANTYARRYALSSILGVVTAEDHELDNDLEDGGMKAHAYVPKVVPVASKIQSEPDLDQVLGPQVHKGQINSPQTEFKSFLDTVPGIKSAASTSSKPIQGYMKAPEHCGKPMMVSKFNEHEWYCMTCKHKEKRVI